MRILLLHSKHYRIAFDATGDRLTQAYLEAFIYQDCIMDCYSWLPEETPWLTKDLNAARRNDAQAAKTVLGRRRDFEYEGWELIEIITPEEVESWRKEKPTGV